MTTPLEESLTLPCGLILPNRLVKAAMTEGLAAGDNQANTRHVTLYNRWADGRVGMQITGNVLVDRRYLEAPGNIVIEGKLSLNALTGLKMMAKAAGIAGAKVIMQISHAGRQCPKVVCDRPIAPSAVPLDMPGRSLMPFGDPRAMTGDEVDDVILRFVHAIRIAEETGFHGVQIHAAHGYLISQFLSPRTNRRTDKWGGTLENRSRLLLEIIREARQVVGKTFAIGVKLNSADFQSGGFTHEDCLAVVDWLNTEAVDFIEISGGNYEQPQMMGMDGVDAPVSDGRLKASTIAREAYFVEYARAVRDRAKMPVLATGGFRTRAAMNHALEMGQTDLIGLARPLCAQPDLPGELLSGRTEGATDYTERKSMGPTVFLGRNSPFKLVKALNGWGLQAWHMVQIARMADGLEPDTGLGLLKAMTKAQASQKASAEAYHQASV